MISADKDSENIANKNYLCNVLYKLWIENQYK